MRVLISTIEFPPGPGGIGSYMYHLARHLALSGCEVVVATPQEHADSVDAAAFNAAQPFLVHPLRPAGSAARRYGHYLREIHRAARALRPDVLLASGELAAWSTCAVAAVIRRPWAVVGNGSEFVREGAALARLNRVAFGRADLVLPISRYVQALRVRAGIRPRREQIVHCGADEMAVSGPDAAGVRARLGIPEGRMLLTVGAVKDRKGQDTVIQALPRLAAEFPDLVYVVAGRGEPDRLRALAKELGVAGRVVFTGSVSAADLPALYAASDVFVMLSRQTAAGEVEGYGIVALEAALAGKPSVVTRGCGLEEAVVDGVTGVLVDPADPGQAAQALGVLLRDDALRARMGRAGRERVLAQGTWTRRMEEVRLLLCELAARPGARRAPARLTPPAAPGKA